MENAKIKLKIVFLYTEIAGYFLSCVNELSKHANVEVHIIKWPVHKDAPFQFRFNDSVFIYDRKEFENDKLYLLVKGIDPAIIYCAGWIDKGYLDICKKIQLSIPVILGFDNIWTGSLKQRLSLLYAKNTFLKYFSHCFIPGQPQLSFAKRMGFEEHEILSGIYCADVSYFSGLFEKNKQQKYIHFPKRFIYVGRYVGHKGIRELWNAFVELHIEVPNEWELWCFGTGPVKPYEHSKIKHFGFVQPDEMEKYISQTGVFILPSIFEPWGVVVHEFAAAGYPLLCSDKVGSGSGFLIENVNGYSFKAGNTGEIKSAMKKIIQMPTHKLIEMCEKSAEFSHRITPATWAITLLSVMKQ